MIHSVDYVVIGAGLAGLAFTRELESDSVVILERDARPGGLLKSLNINGFWFDSVVHLLYFHNSKIKGRFLELLSEDFIPLPQRANVVTEQGETLFPFQFNLGGLPVEEALNCAVDFVTQLTPQEASPTNFADWLLRSFGKRMCEIFFYPYNQKVWKRDLADLATRDFVWTIQEATTRSVLAGLIADQEHASYNAKSIYPVPPPDSKLRGMEILVDLIAKPLGNKIRLREEVTRIDSVARTVTVNKGDDTHTYHYRKGCISTLPLPMILRKMGHGNTDPDRLTANGVVYAMVMLRGKRWQTDMLSTYYSAPDLVFNRIIYMQNFDPYSAPPGFWSIMVEVTYRTEEGAGDLEQLRQQIEKDLIVTGIVEQANDFVDVHLEIHPYGYVVFDTNTDDLVRAATADLAGQDIHLLGRYGKWQYINITQGYEEAMDLAHAFNGLPC